VEHKILLHANALWVQCPEVLLLPFNGRNFEVKVNTEYPIKELPISDSSRFAKGLSRHGLSGYRTIGFETKDPAQGFRGEGPRSLTGLTIPLFSSSRMPQFQGSMDQDPRKPTLVYLPTLSCCVAAVFVLLLNSLSLLPSHLPPQNPTADFLEHSNS
jgi:hypothetical protein